MSEKSERPPQQLVVEGRASDHFATWNNPMNGNRVNRKITDTNNAGNEPSRNIIPARASD
jgi:hypothetical protein